MESMKNKRVQPYDLAQRLLEYDVVSFDVFDTLVLRPFLKHSDLFLILSSQYKETNFQHIRMLAEKEARIEKLRKYNTDEINIYEIYEKLSEYINIDPLKGSTMELDLEMEICFANPYMKLIYDILIEYNKKIIVVSNTYIPANWMKKLLNQCGYSNIVEVFSSCDYGFDKKSTKLFKTAAVKMAPHKSFIHVGEDIMSDIESAKKVGWDAQHYLSVHTCGGGRHPPIADNRSQGLSPLIGSAYRGIVNSRFYNGLLEESDFYEYGYKCGGPFAVGFAAWIHDKCMEGNVEKILFTSRDGYTIKQVYEELFQDIPCEYALWSRSIASRLSITHMPHYFKESLLYDLKAHKFEYKVMDQLNYFKVPHLESKLSLYGLSADTQIGTRHIKQYEKFICFITDNIDEVKKALINEGQAAKEYYQGLLKTCKKVAAVDIGWSGMNINVMKTIIESEWKPDCSVMGLLAVMHPKVAKCNPVQLLTKDQQVYMFSPVLNPSEMNFINKGPNYLPYFYEILSGAPHSSIYRIENNANGDLQFVFDIPDVENYRPANEIRKGMLDYCDDYKQRFKQHEFMYRIPGSDVAMIIQKHLEDIVYLYKVFGNLPYNIGRLMPAFEQNVTNVKHFIK